MKNEKIKNLESKILYHKRLYYQGKPEISDFEYDNLESELKKLAPKSFALDIVGSDSFSSEKISHAKKMLSLDKSYSIDELLKWKGDEEVLSTFKIDGSSCSLIYEKGQLRIAKTRGDGRFGENITEKIFYMPSIPKKINTDSSFEVRGEIFCEQSDFLALAKEMEARGLELPSSQRNIVAGIIGRRENINLAKYLRFQAFELIGEKPVAEESEKFLELKKMKFETPDFFLHKSEKTIQKELTRAQDFMGSGDYLIDGIVFTYNKVSLHTKLGETAHHPRYKMAFKFQGESQKTKIESISWQVSRNGYLTPVANVEPVELGGAKISRVTLHNFGLVNEYKLKAGDEIEIIRSGEVIPKFLSVKTRGRGTFEVPEICPSCEEKVFQEDIRIICKNNYCPDKVKDEILNFIKKVGIDDLSSKRLEELIRLGLVKDISSLYELTKEALLGVDKVKEKLANKLIENIERSKQVDLTTFLSGLGLSGGAYNKCEKIVLAGYNTIEKVMNLKEEELIEIDSFAELSAKSLIKSLHEKEKLVAKLISYGFELKSNLATKSSGILNGEKFCITGTLSMKRSDLQKLVKASGGVVQSSVSKETNYLLTNDTESSSSKFKKAKDLLIPIINEHEFFNLIGREFEQK